MFFVIIFFVFHLVLSHPSGAQTAYFKSGFSTKEEAYNFLNRRQLNEGELFFQETTKNAEVASRIVRRDSSGNAQLTSTTDVWELNGYSYIGTFNDPCGDGSLISKNTGIRVYDTSNPTKMVEVGFIPSVKGARCNDVKVFDTKGIYGKVLAYTNERCSVQDDEQGTGGEQNIGGFELWSVNNPLAPVRLASIRIGELNKFVPLFFDEEFREIFETVGTHNLWFFKRNTTTYISAVAESLFDNFRVYDLHKLISLAAANANRSVINPPTVTSYGSEEVRDPGVSNISTCFGGVQCSQSTLDGLSLFDKQKDKNMERIRLAIRYMFCVDVNHPCPPETDPPAANRFLHDMYTAPYDGDLAPELIFLNLWDTGMAIMNLGGLDLKNPSKLLSIAINITHGSLDGNVNSHSSFPFMFNDSGSHKLGVLELNEDFSAWESQVSSTTPTFDLAKRDKGLAVILKNTLVFNLDMQGVFSVLRLNSVAVANKRSNSLLGAEFVNFGKLSNLFYEIDAIQLFELEAINRGFTDFDSMFLLESNLKLSLTTLELTALNPNLVSADPLLAFFRLSRDIAISLDFESTVFLEDGSQILKDPLFLLISVAGFSGSELFVNTSTLGLNQVFQLASNTLFDYNLLLRNSLFVSQDIINKMIFFDTLAFNSGFISVLDLFRQFILLDRNLLAIEFAKLLIQQSINVQELFDIQAPLLDSKLQFTLQMMLDLSLAGNDVLGMTKLSGYQIAVCGIDSFSTLDNGEPTCRFIYSEGDDSVVLSIEGFLEDLPINENNCLEIIFDEALQRDVCSLAKVKSFFIDASLWSSKKIFASCSSRQWPESLVNDIIQSVLDFKAGNGPLVLVFVEETNLCSNIQIAEILAKDMGVTAIVFLDINRRSSDTAWGGLRIWDISDVTKPVLLSTLYSPCGATTHWKPNANDPPGTVTGESLKCLSGGAYTPHNAFVVGTKAFVSWYADGVVIVDLSDPRNPVVTSQLSINCPVGNVTHPSSITAPPDVWGVYKSSGQGSHFLYSDRNCGLGIGKELGN